MYMSSRRLKEAFKFHWHHVLHQFCCIFQRLSAFILDLLQLGLKHIIDFFEPVFEGPGCISFFALRALLFRHGGPPGALDVAAA